MKDAEYKDKKSAIEAIHNEDNALKYTSSELLKDEDILIIAVQRHNYPIEYLTDELNIDEDIAVEIIDKVFHLNMHVKALKKINGLT